MKKRELQQRVNELQRALNALSARQADQRKTEEQQFEKAIRSTMSGQEVRVIAPNGTIFRALVTNADVQQDVHDVGLGGARELIPGLRTVTLMMRPMPGGLQ